MTFDDRPPARTFRLRAGGIRLPYERLPAQLHRWVGRELNAAVTEARTLAGGMSPGCAARLCTEDGRVVFLKAVGAELNPDTPQLFRHEIAILRALPRVSYRPDLIAAFDDGDWVGLLLEYVEGRHPDFTNADDAAAAWRVVRTQAQELTPGPAGLRITTLADNVRRWADRWRAVMASPADYLPGWAVWRAVRSRAAAARPRVRADAMPLGRP